MGRDRAEERQELDARFPTAAEFCVALDAYWGAGGWFRWAADPSVIWAACPSCKSKPLRRVSLSAAFPLEVVEQLDGTYYTLPWCGCPDEAITNALGTAALALAMGGGRRAA